MTSKKGIMREDDDSLFCTKSSQLLQKPIKQNHISFFCDYWAAVLFKQGIIIVAVFGPCTKQFLSRRDLYGLIRKISTKLNLKNFHLAVR
jgi:hypothetical protein